MKGIISLSFVAQRSDDTTNLLLFNPIGTSTKYVCTKKGLSGVFGEDEQRKINTFFFIVNNFGFGFRHRNFILVKGWLSIDYCYQSYSNV